MIPGQQCNQREQQESVYKILGVFRNLISHVLQSWDAVDRRCDSSAELPGRSPRLSIDDLDMGNIITLADGSLVIRLSSDNFDMGNVITLADGILVVAGRTLLPEQGRARAQHSTHLTPVLCLFAELDFVRIGRFTADGERPVDTFVSLVVKYPRAHVDVGGRRASGSME